MMTRPGTSSPIEAMPAVVLPLAKAQREVVCGGKAAGLARAMELGIPVPDGFVVTYPAFEAFLQQGGLGARIVALLASVSVQDIARLRTSAAAISDQVIAAALPPGVHDALLDAWEHQLHSCPVIVRSSAVGEDSTEASFAGQLDSFLSIDNPVDLENAVKRCWASYWSERALAYRASSGKQLQGMGVLIQRQVDSRLAGVLFTRPPLKHEESRGDYLLGEFCLGQGIALVSGEINPGQFRIFRHDLSWEKLTDPEQPGIPGPAPELSSGWIQALAGAALRLEDFHNRPQDIEWALDDAGRLFIVQSRPIVEHPGPAVAAPMITWSNANVRENFPDPVTPLLYSVASTGYSHYFRNLGLAFGISRRRIAAMEGPLRTIIGAHGARIYYNLSSIHSVIRMAPFGAWLIQYFNSFVGASETPPPSPGDRQFRDLDRHRALQWLELVQIVAKTAWKFLTLGRRVARFEASADQFAAGTRPEILDSLGLTELRDRMRAFMDIRQHRWTDAGLADAASMICYGLLNSLLRSTFPGEQHRALPNSLLKGVTGLVSSEPVFDLWLLSRLILQDAELERLFTGQPADAILEALHAADAGQHLTAFSRAFNRYLETWGFRCSGELMLTVPSFQENPAGLIGILKSYLQVTGESPLEVLQRQKSVREEQTQEVLDRIADNPAYGPLQRLGRAVLLKRFLVWTQGAIGMRERARLKQALLYARLRRVTLSIGERLAGHGLLAQADDIFFLTCGEIDELASSRAMFPHGTRELVKLRREHHRRLSAMNPPDSFVMEEGVCLDEGDYTDTASSACETTEGRLLEGTTACGGKIQGRATVLRDVSESAQLDAGDILITTQTDPGWGHVFFLIKGLIIERGGMLSHGAILAREFGIPAIVGVRDATRRIPQHASVFLDGDRGRVHVLE
jgi:phosphohistidine swiveling domain-containing protein